MKVKQTPYDYLYYSFSANLPLTGGHREYFRHVWKELDKIIERDYELKKGKHEL
jgi:hypothetical protein